MTHQPDLEYLPKQEVISNHKVSLRPLSRGGVILTTDDTCGLILQEQQKNKNTLNYPP